MKKHSYYFNRANKYSKASASANSVDNVQSLSQNKTKTPPPVYNNLNNHHNKSSFQTSQDYLDDYLAVTSYLNDYKEECLR